jgi:hypothetical protein
MTPLAAASLSAHQRVLAQARAWYRPDRVAVDEGVLQGWGPGTVPPAPEDAPVLGIDRAANTFSEAVELAIALSAINHQFWDLDERGQFVRYTHHGAVGALAMSQAFQRAWQSPANLLFSIREGHALTPGGVALIFGDIPAPEGRRAILNEVLGSSQLAHAVRVMRLVAHNGDPFDADLAEMLAEMFPLAFGDPLLKKAQLAVSLIWREARARGHTNTCTLTAFADYQIPNVLRALGGLTYAVDLAATIDAGHLIEPDSTDERAIRAASILAVETLAESQGVAVADVDFWLWQQRGAARTPFHRTRTTLY